MDYSDEHVYLSQGMHLFFFSAIQWNKDLPVLASDLTILLASTPNSQIDTRHLLF